MIETVRLPFPVPYCAQLASEELAEAIFVHGLDPVQDPRWAESGAASTSEYAYWVERACGVACLKMCLEALGGPVRPLIEWARLGVQKGGYRPEVGWVHGVLAGMAREAGFPARSMGADLPEIVQCLKEGRLVIASVSHEAGDERIPVTKRGGHLMVVVGAECVAGEPRSFLVHNPSGRRREWRAYASLGTERFASAFSGRIITVGPRNGPIGQPELKS